MSVQVLDNRGPAGGATHASAGMLAPFIEGHFGPLLTVCTESLSLYDQFVERVAAEAGFGSVQALRHHFQARLGLSPRDYRASFGKAR